MSAQTKAPDGLRKLLEELKAERTQLAQTVRSLEAALAEAGLSVPSEVSPEVVQVFHELMQLPQDDQKSIASRMLDEIEDERKWNASFAATGDKLDALADEARREIREGRTTPLNPEEI